MTEGRQVISIYPIATDIISGSGTTTSTVACTLTSHACVKFTIQADGGNTGNIWIGPSTVTSTSGLKLSAGQQIPIDANNTKIAYIYATSSTQNYQWVAVV